MKTKRKILILAVILVTISILATTPACSSKVKDISLEIDCPLHVTKGDNFIFEIHVTNTSSDSQLLYSIDIWDEYMEGISILKTEPAFTDTYHVPVDNTQSFEFQKEIPPQETIILKFYAVGHQAGEYSSYLDACINSGSSFISYPIITMVDD